VSSGWSESFRAFSAHHVVVVLVCAGVMLSLCLLGRRWMRQDRTRPRERRLRVAWAVFIAAWQVAAQAWWLLPGNFVLDKSLPLHVCDIAAMLAPVALLTGWRAARTIVWFWGVGLSTQAFFTPVLAEGCADPEYWLFWVGHTQIVGTAAYLAAVMGYRPSWRDLALATSLSLLYAGAMVALNVSLGTNYGYVGPSKPERPTVIDALGPWPGRVTWLCLIGTGAMALTWVPFAVAGARGSRAFGRIAQ
jgi:hypothetical integral membrane protein (TIGR02206 family)